MEQASKKTGSIIPSVVVMSMINFPLIYFFGFVEFLKVLFFVALGLVLIAVLAFFTALFMAFYGQAKYQPIVLRLLSDGRRRSIQEMIEQLNTSEIFVLSAVQGLIIEKYIKVDEEVAESDQKKYTITLEGHYRLGEM